MHEDRQGERNLHLEAIKWSSSCSRITGIISITIRWHYSSTTHNAHHMYNEVTDADLLALRTWPYFDCFLSILEFAPTPMFRENETTCTIPTQRVLPHSMIVGQCIEILLMKRSNFVFLASVSSEDCFNMFQGGSCQ